MLPPHTITGHFCKDKYRYDKGKSKASEAQSSMHLKTSLQAPAGKGRPGFIVLFVMK